MRKADGGQEGRHILCKEREWFRVDSGAAGFEHTGRRVTGGTDVGGGVGVT